jgi:MATE family multidrug resistance protein
VTVAAFGALRGLHDMKTPLWIAAGSNAINAILAAVLITGMGPVPGFGIAGAGFAAVISQWAGAVYAALAIRRRLGFPARIDWRRTGALLVVGRDLFLRTGLLVLFVALTTRAATRLGPEAGAAHQAIRQIWILSAFALDAFAASAQSLVGYFMGAGKPAHARRVASVAVAWGTGLGAAIAGGMLVAEDAVAALLVPLAATPAFASGWWIAAAAQPLSAVSFVTDGIHWGTRDYRYLRNAMATASAGGALLLFLGEASSRATLASVWWITALWIAVRAAAGAARVWPGVGRAPLARGAAAREAVVR